MAKNTGHTSEIGSLIGGKYELVEKVGEGGMAVVYRALMHGAAGFTRPVAVKKIKREYRAIKNYINMFVEEARVGSELAHPNIVQVFDFCADEEGAYYLIMEWVEGLDMAAFIRSYLRKGEMPPWQEIVAIGVGVLRGLAAAHERRRMDGTFAPVIHRDVSPHNILMACNGVVKLTDFGLARARDRMFSLTAPGTVKGKLSYLAPEITRGEGATPHSDLFSMGTVLWESLAGRRLFDGRGDLEVFKKIRACEVKPLVDYRENLPTRLLSAVHRALQKKPIDRFASARAMASELAEVLKDADFSETSGVHRDLHRELGMKVQDARRSLGMAVPGAAAREQVDVRSLESVEITFSSLDSSPLNAQGTASLHRERDDNTDDNTDYNTDHNTDDVPTAVEIPFSDPELEPT